MRRLFNQHPASVGETYGEHLVVAFGFGGRMIAAGAACLIHGLLPFAFERTASRAVVDLNEQMISKRTSRLVTDSRQGFHGAD